MKLVEKPLLANYHGQLDAWETDCALWEARDFEWVCLECNDKGMYQEIRAPLDRGVDLCPECNTEVVNIDT